MELFDWLKYAARTGGKMGYGYIHPSLYIAQSRNHIRNNYTMYGQIIASVENVRYLGVDISLDLNFSYHTNRITSNAQKSFGLLKEEYKN